MSWERLPRVYDHVADLYEARFLDELAGKPRDRELLAAFGSSAGDPVVELGCGPGQVGAFVRAVGRRVVGLDLSPAMARLASGRLDGAVVGDLRRLPFRSGALGGLLAFYSLIHVRRPEVPQVFGELARVLRAGSRLLLAVHEGEGELAADEFLGEPVPFVATLFGLDELVAAASSAGLEVVLAERRQPYEDGGNGAVDDRSDTVGKKSKQMFPKVLPRRPDRVRTTNRCSPSSPPLGTTSSSSTRTSTSTP